MLDDIEKMCQAEDAWDAIIGRQLAREVGPLARLGKGEDQRDQLLRPETAEPRWTDAVREANMLVARRMHIDSRRARAKAAQMWQIVKEGRQVFEKAKKERKEETRKAKIERRRIRREEKGEMAHAAS